MVIFPYVVYKLLPEGNDWINGKLPLLMEKSTINRHGGYGYPTAMTGLQLPLTEALQGAAKELLHTGSWQLL